MALQGSSGPPWALLLAAYGPEHSPSNLQKAAPKSFDSEHYATATGYLHVLAEAHRRWARTVWITTLTKHNTNQKGPWWKL